MDDERIVELYFERDESAISESEKKYGRYCLYIAMNILSSDEDAEECVNDTYLAAWNSIPPHKPQRLSAYLGRLTRNISLNRYERDRAKKRVPSTELILEESFELIPESVSATESENLAITEALDSFLGGLTKRQRIIFLRRYYYMCSISEIAGSLSLSESNVKVILSRTRKSLRAYLEKEGISI